MAVCMFSMYEGLHLIPKIHTQRKKRKEEQKKEKTNNELRKTEKPRDNTRFCFK